GGSRTASGPCANDASLPGDGVTISETRPNPPAVVDDLRHGGEGHGAAVFELAMQLGGATDDDAVVRVLHAAGYQPAFVNQARGACHAALRSATDRTDVQAALALLDEAMSRALSTAHW